MSNSTGYALGHDFFLHNDNVEEIYKLFINKYYGNVVFECYFICDGNRRPIMMFYTSVL